MNDSNQTLKFSRTAREAYGHDITFEDEYHRGDRLVGLVVAFAWGFMVAMWVFM